MTTFKDLVPSAPEGRFDGIERPYTPEDVAKLRGSVQIQHTLAERGAVKLWELLKTGKSFLGELQQARASYSTGAGTPSRGSKRRRSKQKLRETDPW